MPASVVALVVALSGTAEVVPFPKLIDETAVTTSDSLATYSACFVMFSNTPTHASVTNSDEPP